MSDAPERVWLHPDGTYITAIPTEHGFTGYIRDDIHAKAVEALRRVGEMPSPHMVKEYIRRTLKDLETDDE